MIRNRFKQAVRERRPQIGVWSSLCSNIGAEILADAGFDWILLDTEHSPNELPGLLSQMQAIGRDQATPVGQAAAAVPRVGQRSLQRTFQGPRLRTECRAANQHPAE
jgi:4-hydroxy-2-oxoheptanedioate aldolase